MHDLRKCYGEMVAVDRLSLEVEQGEIFGLVGPNGSGKTTTVECLQGLRRRDGGEVSVLGLDPGTERRRLVSRIGGQLQDSALPDRIKVWEALNLFAKLAPRAADWRLLLDQWGLSEKRDSSYVSLSGGQKQRLFVALALVNAPEIVFLDEMTTGLDPSARHIAWELIEEIRDRGTTVVLVTHFMDEAARLCDRMAVMRSGRLVALDAPRTLASTYGGSTHVCFTCEESWHFDWLKQVPGVDAVRRDGAVITVYGVGPLLPFVASALVERGVIPDDLHAEPPSLEKAYLTLTGHYDEEDE